MLCFIAPHFFSSSFQPVRSAYNTAKLGQKMPTQTGVSGSRVPTKPTDFSRKQMRNPSRDTRGGTRSGSIHGPRGTVAVPGKRLSSISTVSINLCLVFSRQWQACRDVCCNESVESHTSLDAAHHPVTGLSSMLQRAPFCEEIV